MSLEGINKQKLQIGEMEVEIVKLKSKEKKRVPDKLIQGVKEEFRGLVKNILEKVQEIELNENRTRLICTTCDDNWEKTEMKAKPKCSFEIQEKSQQAIKRHLSTTNHRKCVKASDNFQLNKTYYAEIFRSFENKIEKMTENVIRVVYYVIQENLAMLKTESLYNLLEKCGAPIGNQLHSRKTSASIARSIDHIFMEKLTRFIATEESKSS